MPGEPGAAILDQRRFPLEEMRDAGNVEHEPVSPIEGGERGVAGAPVAEPRQKLGLGDRLGLDDDERGKARPRVGERKARSQAEPRGLGVEADEPLRIVDFGDRDKRRALVNATEPPCAVGRQTRQPEGEESPACHRPCPRKSYPRKSWPRSAIRDG